MKIEFNDHYKGTVRIGDWVRPYNHGMLPGLGCIYGQVVGEGEYGGRLHIPAWLVDGSYGEAKPQLCPKDVMEYWFTPDKERDA